MQCNGMGGSLKLRAAPLLRRLHAHIARIDEKCCCYSSSHTGPHSLSSVGIIKQVILPGANAMQPKS